VTEQGKKVLAVSVLGALVVGWGSYYMFFRDTGQKKSATGPAQVQRRERDDTAVVQRARDNAEKPEEETAERAKAERPEREKKEREQVSRRERDRRAKEKKKDKTVAPVF